MPPEDDAGAAGGGAAVAAPPADSTPAGSASSAMTLDDMPFPDVPGLTDGGDAGVDGKDGQPAGGGSAAGGDGDDATALQALAAARDAAGGDGEGEELELPFDDEATLQAFLEEYGPAILNHPKAQQYFRPVVQSIADRELAERARMPENDERYAAEQARENQALQDFGAELRKLESGELADGQVIAKTFLEARGAIKQAEGIAAQRAADGVVLALTTQLNQAAGRDLFTPELRQRYAEADQIFARLHNATTRDRAGNIVPDERARARALPEYVRRTLEIVADAAIELGRGQGRAATAVSQANRDTLTRSNLQRQMAAGVARATPRSPGASPKPRVTLSREVLTAGTWRDTQKAMQAAGESI